jgi:hypothetical protein
MVIPLVLIFISVTLYFTASHNALRYYVLLGLIPGIIIILVLLNRGFLQVANALFIIIIIAFISWSCVRGNGIHDIGIVVYPLMILFGSLVLERNWFWGVTGFIILSVGFLSIGGRFGLYTPYPIFPGRFSDFLVLGFIFSVGFVSITLLTNRMNKSLRTIAEGVRSQESLKGQIEDKLASKHQLFREVHHRVKNHLALIHSIIDMELMEENEENQKKLEATQQRASAVAKVHNQLYQSDNYEHISSKDYLESVISNFLMTYHLSDISLDLRIEDHSLPVDTIIYLGVISHEIILALHEEEIKPDRMSVVFDHDDAFYFTIVCNCALHWEETEQAQLLLHLAEKLQGELDLVVDKQQTFVELRF